MLYIESKEKKKLEKEENFRKKKRQKNEKIKLNYTTIRNSNATKEFGVFHTKNCGSWHMCEINLVVSFVIMYKMWYLL